MRKPFKDQEISGYEFYKSMCCLEKRKPLKQSDWESVNCDINERAIKNKTKIVKRAKKYKCYVL